MLRNLVNLSLVIAMSVLCGCSSWGGNFRGEPHEMDANISDGAKKLIQQAFAIEGPIVDYHIHIIARGTSTDCDAYISPDLNTWLKPILKSKTLVLMSASGVDDYARLDQQYANRLLALLLHFQSVQQNEAYVGNRLIKSQFHVYAIDYYYNEKDRQRNVKRTDMYVPNDCVINLAQEFNRKLEQNVATKTLEVVPVASVHPYRDDFQVRIDELAQQKIKFMKWIPSSMNIDMRKVKLSHYAALAKAGITLLIHTGNEHAFRVYDDKQQLGDPALLSHVLAQKVRVLALHVGREGQHPQEGDSYFARFMEIMQNTDYENLLSGEISAITVDDAFLGIIKGSQDLIPVLIENTQSSKLLVGRIYNGSDYPISAVALLNPTRGLVKRGMITPDEREYLDEIRAYNPLLFDFVVKRTIKHPQTKTSFPPEVFQAITEIPLSVFHK